LQVLRFAAELNGKDDPLYMALRHGAKTLRGGADRKLRPLVGFLVQTLPLRSAVRLADSLYRKRVR
jgi:hypothetical protein